MVIEYISNKEDDVTEIGFEIGWSGESESSDIYDLIWIIKGKDIGCNLRIRNLITDRRVLIPIDTVPLKLPYNIIAALEVLTTEVNKKYEKQIIDPFSRVRLESWYDGFNHLEEVLLDMGVDKDLLHTALLRVVNEGWKPIR